MGACDRHSCSNSCSLQEQHCPDAEGRAQVTACSPLACDLSGDGEMLCNSSLWC